MISHMSHPPGAREPQRSLRHTSAVSPKTVRKAVEENHDDNMFSPTSAAALALSTLHHFGAQRDKGDPSPAIRGTRLFNGGSTSNQMQVASAGHASSTWPRSSSPVQNYASHSFEYASTSYNTHDPGVPVSEPDRSHSSQKRPASWGHPAAHSYPTYYNQTDSNPPSARASPTLSNTEYYPDEHRNSYHNHHRSSPVNMTGPSSTPMPRPSSFHHPQPPPLASDTSKFAHLASCASTLVTPTPKKAKLEHNTSSDSVKSAPTTKAPSYSRKKKSLGILAENFLNTYQNFPKGSTIVVDEAAVKLGVERRRIYDVVNILESICLVCKKHKNTYTWMGMEHLDAVFGRLQSQAIAEYPEDAEKYLGSRDRKNFMPVPLKPPRKQSKTRENKSLAKLSQEFLQVFLVGHETLSLPEASDKIQGTTSVEELIAMGSSKANASTEKELKAAAARGLKTKIRRLYDIANVFLSVGLLKKVDSGDSSRRPNFSWSYKVSAKDLYNLHRPKEDAAIPVTQSQESTGSYSETEGTSASSAASSPSSK